MNAGHNTPPPTVTSRILSTRYGHMLVPQAENDVIGQFLARYGEWAYLEANFAASVIGPGARVLDGGAFAGTFGLGVAMAASVSFLCCVEANPAMTPMLAHNISTNAPCEAKVLEALLTSEDIHPEGVHAVAGNMGATSFADSDEDGTTAIPDSTSAARKYVTLKQLRAEYGAFDLIKLDIEGMELAALQGDAAFLAQGGTTLWLEANEHPQTLVVARTLLEWGLELYYFAFPSFNPGNFNRNQEPFFPFAYEAALLAAPRSKPVLTQSQRKAGCVLRRLASLEDAKHALWLTPRWGMPEWPAAATASELAALAGRSLRAENFARFLAPESLQSPDAGLTLWQRLAQREDALREAHDELSKTHTVLHDAQNALGVAHTALGETQASLSEAHTAYAEAQSAYEAAQAALLAEQRNAATWRSEAESLAPALQAAQAECARLSLELQTAQLELHTAQLELHTAKSASEIAAVRLAASDDILAAHTAQLSSEQAAREALTETSRLLSRELEAAEAALEQLSAQAAARQLAADEAQRAAQALAEDRLRGWEAALAEVSAQEAALAELSAQAATRQLAADAALAEAVALAEERLRCWQAAQHRSQQLEDTLAGSRARAEALGAALGTAEAALHALETSTIWRATGVLRRIARRLPIARRVARRGRLLASRLRHWLRRHNPPAPAAAAQPQVATTDIDPHHRDAIRALFDQEFYLAANPDVLRAGIDPVDHFLIQGWRELRAPSTDFDTAYYLDQYPDVAASGMNPLLHYVWAGQAEGRRAQPSLAMMRQALANARAPREQATEWEGGADTSPALSMSALTALLEPAAGAVACAVSVSHDDYASNYGGIQNLIAGEQRAFEAAGWAYLHLSPAAPLPTLAPDQPANALRLRLRLNGQAVGIARFADLAYVINAMRVRQRKFQMIFHHLLGHVPEKLATLCQPGDAAPIVWVHDFFTLCPSYTLMRNSVKFCAGPAADAPGCGVCVAGPERPLHTARIERFFATIRPAILAPSAITLAFWAERNRYTTVSRAHIAPARLTMGAPLAPKASASGRRLRVAYLGAPLLHKGWSVFAELASRHADDPRYGFYHLGVGSVASARYRQVHVRVSPEAPNAMVDAVRDQEIDVVICWPLWPETFCFAVHEALAGGAFVVARAQAGNVWPAIAAHAPAQGCAIDEERALFALFEDGDIVTMAAQPRRQGVITAGGATADCLLAETVGVPANLQDESIPA